MDKSNYRPATPPSARSARACKSLRRRASAARWTYRSGKDGDAITLDARTGCLDLEVTEAELNDRRTTWQPRQHDYGSGVLWRYARTAGPAHLGAVTHPGAAGERHVYADI
jgi:hypothetical protein